ncbi:hypothetical protein H8356DRAFT_1283572 [Neocallimastix lanati (nom. inval.)]|nr:hypothetical protein H8356DRAFT_1283572 [Neocallimastix sp. JGI-2020a]
MNFRLNKISEYSFIKYYNNSIKTAHIIPKFSSFLNYYTLSERNLHTLTNLPLFSYVDLSKNNNNYINAFNDINKYKNLNRNNWNLKRYINLKKGK